MKQIIKLHLSLLFVLLMHQAGNAQTIALWLFDEQAGLYPSCTLDDSGPNDYPMVLGQGGQIVGGKFGNALEPLEHPSIVYPAGTILFGLRQAPIPAGRTVEPLSWMNANFCAFMTSGENHLRKEVGFVNATQTQLNLGSFDWTVEFWFLPTKKTNSDGVVFEIGTGPRGENAKTTQLLLKADLSGFVLHNDSQAIDLDIATDLPAVGPVSSKWYHFAFVYSTSEQQLRHFVDGKLQRLPEKLTVKSLDPGDEAYFCVGRDGLWKRPLPGRLDELRFSAGKLYESDFEPPASFAPKYPEHSLTAGPPLLFDQSRTQSTVIKLGGRKHLFIDDAIVSEMHHIAFTANPPRLAECVIDSIEGPFRKHLSVIEDENGLIRLYYGGPDDYLAVRTSRDGIRWEIPDLKQFSHKGARNIVIPEPTAMGNVFIDPNAPPASRWKYMTGFHDRGIYVYYSPDGWSFKRIKTAALPFRSGSQSNAFYDEQRQSYVGYHRSDFGRTLSGATQREFGMTETKSLVKPIDFKPLGQGETQSIAKAKRLSDIQPWYLDNGPLTPGGVGVEFPMVFTPLDTLDPAGTDMYVPKAMKYPWAPDTYLAFPLMYFHYEHEKPPTREILGHPDRKRGSGPIETQLSVSRDGVHWKRYPRPAYVGIGRHGKYDIHQSYFAHGMVKRGSEIWQYYFAETRYHSSWEKDDYVRAVYRVVQRLDGFVSADSPYDKPGVIITKPLTFAGNRLILNIDTDAAGYAQVGFLDELGNDIEGFSVDDCIYINGDFVETQVEWMKNRETLERISSDDEEIGETFSDQVVTSKDVSELAGKKIRLIFRMRGSKLYSMQFAEKN